ncbi:Sapep family Mn(2+)-dependent dipeptidase [Oscillospiraceae bacterium LTW-04]|nr:Sapep family Mn(2+)-dependent dipeptidase [Oscillospiraceae bacterium MB24-C1]
MAISAALLQGVDRYLAAHEKEMVSDLCRLIEIKSITQPNSSKETPYGRGCLESLQAMGNICAKKGLTLQNHENQCASLRWGEGSEELGIFTHLDVVPAGNGWTTDAFIPVVENGFVRGRGSIDNKGSAIVGLYALDCIRSLKLPMKHAVRLFYGCNEEDMMTDVEYYGKTVGWPKFSLVPDSMFPAAFAEKGIFAGSVISEPIADEILLLQAGTATNTVASECEILVAKKHFEVLKAQANDQVTITCEGEYTKLHAIGLSAHASMPEQSLNAIGLGLDALLRAGILHGEEKSLIAFWRDVLLDVTGKTLGIAQDMGEYGLLTIIGGLARRTEDGRFVFGFNCRYPAKDSCKRIEPLMRAACTAHGLDLTVEEGVDGFCMPSDHPVVTAMTAIANELTGESRTPFLMKGATYCRVIPNAIPFGPEMDSCAPAFPVGRGGIHQPDESFSIKEMLNATKIYVAALLELDAML